MRLGELVAGSIAAAALVVGVPAHASLLFQGVTFTTTYTANTLVLEIDAAGRNGDWASAVSVDALQIKNVGSFASVSMSGPGGVWTFDPEELNASGCDGGGGGGGRACFTHAPVALGDDMVFTFTFTGGVLDLDTPHVKVHFLNAAGGKQGSLLSMNVPGTPSLIPEPETYALLLAGLGLLGFAARRRKARSLRA
jgi:hypothetical protein